ncbi:efflux RND transporter periplasmic adaptor subunit [Reyranella sp.]|uniref:efflux RND transporter periplasmic adaptor subunit n=1 Tax=Reyranella sp. TaxID=1929291 RepID=UPI002728364E|nr:efflux RND transporter periplasmic adaptor subunit [Reyranella sp.]MDO8976767.1 efflux RND transporter periplasmic adaptor subunit [Reyranella sp.]
MRYGARGFGQLSLALGRRLVGLLPGLLLGLSFVLPVGAQTKSADNAPPVVLVRPVEVRTLAPQSEYVGRLAVFEKVELRARVKGVLGKREFADGTKVTEGQLLFTIDPTSYRIAVNQKRALRDGAQAALINAEAQLKRAAELLRTNNVSQVSYDQRLAEQLQAKATLDDAEAQLEDAELQLSYTKIAAPIAGLIGRSSVSPGNLVGPESGVLATIVNERQIRALFSVPQVDLLNVRRDLRAGEPLAVRLRLADGKLYPEKGKVDFIDVAVDPTTDGQMARAVFDNADELLTDGQTVRVIVEGNEPAKVMVVPLAAMAIDQTGRYVYVVDGKGVVEQRRITVDFVRDGMIAVASGLKEGDRVIVQGQQRVRAGMAVEAQPAPAAAGQPKR